MSGEKDKSGARPKQLSAAQCLRRIKPIPPKFRFLICWDAKRKILRFGCGHGENAVFVCSNRKLEKAVWTDDSAPKLQPACVARFLDGGARVEGGKLLSKCQELLRSYTHVQDQRIYSLFAVWSIATYATPYSVTSAICSSTQPSRDLARPAWKRFSPTSVSKPRSP